MTANSDALSLRSVGFWLAAAGGLLMLVNAVRAFADPVGFATYLGLSLVSSSDAGLVHVYALRALFIALLIGALLVQRQRRALALLAGCAVVMPIGDAVLASSAGAPTPVIARHVLIAVYLCVAAFVLWRRPKRAS